jgi:hypothetical protein
VKAVHIYGSYSGAAPGYTGIFDSVADKTDICRVRTSLRCNFHICLSGRQVFVERADLIMKIVVLWSRGGRLFRDFPIDGLDHCCVPMVACTYPVAQVQAAIRLSVSDSHIFLVMNRRRGFEACL